MEHTEQLSILLITALSAGKTSTYSRMWELRDHMVICGQSAG